jgi:predicted HicB family RNase H-like nuclease
MTRIGRLNKAQRQTYEAAVASLRQGITAAEFSRKFFGAGGMLAKLARTRDERKRLVAGELYRWLQEQLAELRRRETKAFEQEVEALSGRLTVVVPKSLHGALRHEAAQEGVSLSELIRLKLAVPFAHSARMLSERPRPE